MDRVTGAGGVDRRFCVVPGLHLPATRATRRRLCTPGLRGRLQPVADGCAVALSLAAGGSESERRPWLRPSLPVRGDADTVEASSRRTDRRRDSTSGLKNSASEVTRRLRSISGICGVIRDAGTSGRRRTFGWRSGHLRREFVPSRPRWISEWAGRLNSASRYRLMRADSMWAEPQRLQRQVSFRCHGDVDKSAVMMTSCKHLRPAGNIEI